MSWAFYALYNNKLKQQLFFFLVKVNIFIWVMTCMVGWKVCLLKLHQLRTTLFRLIQYGLWANKATVEGPIF